MDYYNINIIVSLWKYPNSNSFEKWSNRDCFIKALFSDFVAFGEEKD